MLSSDSTSTATPPRNGRYLFLLALAFLLVTTWNFAIQTVENPDEPRYAAPARTMIQGGSWLVPEFNGETRLQKPIFFYWVIALTGKVGSALGLELSLAMRLGPLLSGLLALLGTYLLGARLYSPRAGFLAAGIFATTKLPHELSRLLITDMTLTAFLVWCWVFALAALERLREQRAATLPLLGFYLCAGGACMTKGPLLVGLFVVLPLLVFLGSSKRLRELRRAGLWWGIPLALAPNVWWTVELWNRGFHEEVRGYYMLANASRAVSTDVDHYRPVPFVSYIATLGEYFAPWSLALPAVAAWAILRLKRKAHDALENDTRRLLVCALTVPFVVLGLAVSKRALYLLPLYPWLALWIALAWEKTFLSEEGKPAARWPAVPFVLAFLFVGACVSGYVLREKWEPQGSELLWMAVCGVCVAFGLSSVGMQAVQGRRGLASFQLLAVAGLLMIAYESLYRPVEERRENRRAFYAEVDKKLNKRTLVMVGESSNEAVWYLHSNEPIEDVKVAELKEHFFDKPGRALLIKGRDLDRFPALREALIPEYQLQRNSKDTWTLARANPEKKADPTLFIKNKRLSRHDITD